MPKKFAGVNSKAVAARARKDEREANEKARKKKAEEDSKWADPDDKNSARKKERKEEAERKRVEALEKRRERQQLEEEEQKALKSGKNAVESNAKVTRSQIRLRQEEEARLASLEEKRNESRTHLEVELEDNLNRINLESNEAKDVEQAIRVLGSVEKEKDKHPEKRMKAAFEEFEKNRLPQLKAENPNLRLSQLKQLLRKEWMKHPSNPFNQIG